MTGLALLLLQSLLLRAPGAEQLNAYNIREKIWTSEFGSVTMTGTERRHVGKPTKGRRAVVITFDVKIAEKQLSGAAADKWASAELASLREAEDGSLDDQDRLVESDGVAADAYPIFPTEAVLVGAHWQAVANGVTCEYTLDKLENGKAVISTRSDAKTRRGSFRRSGSWTVEVASGRLLSWSLHSDVTYAKGGRETVDSSGEISG